MADCVDGPSSAPSPGFNLKLSEKTDKLEPSERSRYIAKISVIGIDPYLIANDQFSRDLERYPELSSIDIMAYLIETPSPYTAKNFKNYKSSDAYNQFANRWLYDVMIYSPSSQPELRVITGKVLHSQAVSARSEPLLPWVIAADDKIYSAHCTCKAGLGETCTHVATLLFGIDAAVRIREKKTCTQVKCYWIQPERRQVEPAEISQIDFSSATKRKRKLDQAIQETVAEDEVSSSTLHLLTGTDSSRVDQPSLYQPETDLSELFTALSLTGTKSAILSCVEPFADDFIPPETTLEFPPILPDLNDPSTHKMDYATLVQHCEPLMDTLHVSKTAAENVEYYTRTQAKSSMWFRYRAGRITASKMKQVCRTDKGSPSLSLIKSICYPDLYRFSTNATQWGCSHEKMARQEYMKKMKAHHNFQCVDSGLYIHPRYPILGATPDGLVSCSCCSGLGVCEVKCPYCKRDQTMEEAAIDKKFCLNKVDGQLSLSKDHQYFYQVQTQMFITDRSYCDFVVWTKEDIHIERIERDDDLWTEAVAASNNFFQIGVLPELVGKYFTDPPKPLPSIEDMEVESDKYCYCQDVESGNMIMCDNKDCKFTWFHYDCLKLGNDYQPPKTWHCPDCRKVSYLRKGKGKGKGKTK